jgi:hypothetical protein
MARRVPDQKALYKTRLERRQELEKKYRISISDAQMRGHPRKGEPSLTQIIRRRTLKPAQKYAELVRLVNTEGKSVTASLKELGFSRSAFKRQNEKYSYFVRAEESRPGQRAYTIPRLPRFDVITKTGRYLEAVPFAGENASIMGRYWRAVAKAERMASNKPLKPFKAPVYDAEGERIELATDLKVIKSAKKKLSRDQYERSSVMTASG